MLLFVVSFKVIICHFRYALRSKLNSLQTKAYKGYLLSNFGTKLL